MVGIAGKIQFDETHDVKTGPGMQNFLFAQWQPNGDRIMVWPKDSQTGKMISPPWLGNSHQNVGLDRLGGRHRWSHLRHDRCEFRAR
jgi:hypothetical protein